MEQIMELEDALVAAQQAAWALKEAQHKLTGRCWNFVEAYPHPGCAEFAGPDTFFCDNPGEWWVLDEDYDGSPVWWLMCSEHRLREPLDVPVARAEIEPG